MAYLSEMISKEALEEFKKIWKDEFSEDISDQKALDLAINLLTIFNVIYRPIKKEWFNELENGKIEEELKLI